MSMIKSDTCEVVQVISMMSVHVSRFVARSHRRSYALSFVLLSELARLKFRHTPGRKETPIDVGPDSRKSSYAHSKASRAVCICHDI